MNNDDLGSALELLYLEVNTPEVQREVLTKFAALALLGLRVAELADALPLVPAASLRTLIFDSEYVIAVCALMYDANRGNEVAQQKLEAMNRDALLSNPQLLDQAGADVVSGLEKLLGEG